MEQNVPVIRLFNIEARINEKKLQREIDQIYDMCIENDIGDHEKSITMYDDFVNTTPLLASSKNLTIVSESKEIIYGYGSDLSKTGKFSDKLKSKNNVSLHEKSQIES